LLLFVAIVAAVAVVAGWRAVALAQWWAAATVAALASISLIVAWPFARLGVPATRGFGLNPILEHPAMAVHPPLLYTGTALTLGAVLAAMSRRSPRPWLAGSAALVVLAMLLGGVWSYLEQGWGGYWAWDPVENTSLLVWLACLLALHLRIVWQHRSGWWLVVAPWLLTLFGASFVRSGRTPSVHGFAREGAVGLAVLIVAVASTASLWRLARGVNGGSGAVGSTAHAALAGAAFVTVLAGTAYPLVADVFADDVVAVRGEFFARTVGPLALVAVPFVAWRLRDARGRVAHVGFLLLLAGVGASTFDRYDTVSLAAAETVRAAGVAVTGRGVEVQRGPRADTDAVVAPVTVDGHLMRPSIVAYPERGGRLAETAMVTRPWADLQATLVDATDERALLTIRWRPLTWLIWLGAVVMSVGLVPARRQRAVRLSPAGSVSVPATR
jgi:cytochrome c biogenesis factor